jgi:hypothetical protein
MTRRIWDVADRAALASFESCIIHGDAVGAQFGDAMIARAGDGVRVRVTYGMRCHR